MGACGSTQGPVVLIDFENSNPSSDEQAVYDQVKAVVDQTEDMVEVIEGYKGCQDLARQAMSMPSHDNEKAAFEGLMVCVDSISRFYNYSTELEGVFKTLLCSLAGNSFSLESQQGLCTQLATIFDFVLRFDQTRMMRPNLSNDFSYYRRLLPKFNKHPNIKIKDEDATNMAMFTAEHIPMNACINKAAMRAAEKNASVNLVLSTLAMSCATMIKNKVYTNERTNLLCARAMTGCIVLFDQIDTLGSFHKRSPIIVKTCVQLLKRDFPKDCDMLLNAIHYSTKNFNNAPASVQNLFE